MNFSDPSTYIRLCSSILLILSEILPFLPCKSNGVIQILLNLINTNKTCIENAAIKPNSTHKNKKDVDNSLEKSNSTNTISSDDKNISDDSSEDVIIKIHLEEDIDENYDLIENNIFKVLRKMKNEKITDKDVKIKLKQLINDLNDLNEYL